MAMAICDGALYILTTNTSKITMLSTMNWALDKEIHILLDRDPHLQ